MRRIAIELKRPFFEIENWPISELAKWAAHFSLEHEEYQRAKNAIDGVVEIDKTSLPVEALANAVMHVF